MTLRLVAALASTLTLGSFLFPGEAVRAQMLDRECYANEQQCSDRLNQLVDESYQQYRTPPRIIQKRVNGADRVCTGNQSGCSDEVQQEAQSQQNSEVFQQIRETRQQRLEDSLP
ncbi:MAG: hypothetical protein ACRDEA_17380 [Microcystaceae cyanobacterium]